jgi:hypothetical protein
MRRLAGSALAWAVGGVLLAAAAVTVAFLLWWTSSPFDEKAFDRATWLSLAGDMDPDNSRGGMAGALVEQLEREKPTREQVLELLGPAEYPCSELSPPKGPRDTCLSYNLGMWSGLRMDYDTLDIYFDNSGRVARALTVQH